MSKSKGTTFIGILALVIVLIAVVNATAQEPSLGNGVATIFNGQVRPAIEVTIAKEPSAFRKWLKADSTSSSISDLYGPEWEEKRAKDLDPRPSKNFHLWLEAHNHTSVDQIGTLRIKIVRGENEIMLDGGGFSGNDPEDLGINISLWDDSAFTLDAIVRSGSAAEFAVGDAKQALTVYADSSVFFLVRISFGERMRPEELRIGAWMEPPPSSSGSD